jgi:YD repeat-containing protein
LCSAAWAQDDDSSLPSVPDYFQEKGLSSSRAYDTQSPNESIDTFTGKLQYQFTDLLLPGDGGMDLAIRRSYNSIDDPLATPAGWVEHEYSPVGLGWTMHMGRVIRGAIVGICSSSWSVASKNPVLELPDGNRQILYEWTPGGMWITKDFWRATCQGGYLHVQSPDGTTYEMTALGHSFGAPGSLQRTYYAGRIVDRNGNWFNLSYQFLPNGIYALSQITTSDGRGVAFGYTGSTLSTITDTQGNRVWQYTVNNGPGGHVYLAEVQRPDSLFWKYTYRAGTPGTGSMSRIEYPSGGSIDYGYDHVDFKAGTPRHALSTVVKTKTASTNTPDAQTGTWTWNYEVATGELPWTEDAGYYQYTYQIPPVVRSQVNATAVTDPLGNITDHFHLGLQSVRIAPTHVGRSIGKVSAQEAVLYGYDSIPISSQQDVVVNMFGWGSYYPTASVLRTQWHGRAGESFEMTKSGFDEWGNPSSIQETATNNSDRTYSRQTNLTYNLDTNKWMIRRVASETVTVDDQTQVTTRQFDGNGNVLSQTVAGVTTAMTYHSTGDVQTKTNANNQVTTLGNYFRGIPRSESQPEGVSIARAVNAAGNVTSETNGRGKTTTYTFDSLDRVTSITKPVGAPIAVTWGATSRRVQRGSMVDLSTFDGLGRQVRREVSASGESPIWATFSYDALGRKVFQSYPNGSDGTGFRYDVLGRVTRTLHGNTVGSENAAMTEFVQYGSLRVFRRDTTNRGTLIFHRAFSNPDERQVVRSTQGVWEPQYGLFFPVYDAAMTRDLRGQLRSVTLGGKTRTYDYDSRYYLVSRTDPETGTTSFGRDALGNMTSKSIGSGPAATYVYDGRNRLTSVQYPASEFAGVANAPAVVRTYDANDLIRTITAGTVVKRYDYDDADKLTQEELEIDGANSVVSYGYNANEALSSMTYPSGNQLQYNPDAFGRARAVLPHVPEVTYHPNGMPHQIRYANGVISTMEINQRQWPSALQLQRASGASNILSNSYEYDDVGNMTVLSDATDPSYSRSYGYDSLNRLTHEQTPEGIRNFDYDLIGNLASIYQINGAQTYTYGLTSGLLESVAGSTSRTYQYDSAGNVRADGTWVLGHDRANNLRCVACGSATPIVHVYDGENMRVKSSGNGVATNFLHSHDGSLLQTVVPGVERKEHVYLGRRQIAQRRIRLN